MTKVQTVALSGAVTGCSLPCAYSNSFLPPVLNGIDGGDWVKVQDASLRYPQFAHSGGSSFVQRPLSYGDQQRRRRVQPMARFGGNPLARGWHPRLLGNFYLSARYGDRRILVRNLSAGPAPERSVRSDFCGARAEYRQRQGDLEIRTEICVSAEDDVELRRVTLTNHSDRERSIELTSYAEVVLAVPGRMRPIRSSAISSCKRSSYRQIRLSCALGGLAQKAKCDRGFCIRWWLKKVQG